MLKPREAEIVRRFPEIDWTEPIPVRVMGLNASGLGCRFCIAIAGLMGCDVGKLPQTRQEFDAHMKEHFMAQ